METPAEAEQALQMHGTLLRGQEINVSMDEKSKDFTKLIVRGLPEEVKWDELKAHFSGVGKVAFADVKHRGNAPCVGEVRFSTPEQAAHALSLTGSDVLGFTIEVKQHPGSKDGTKLQICNLPPGFEWQELKDLLTRATGATPEFADTTASRGPAAAAEVRFENEADAMQAVQLLNGTSIGGGELTVTLDEGSQDRTRLIVSGVPPGVEWQELKDHFGQVGTVAYANIPKPGQKGGKGANGKGGDFGMGKGMMASPQMQAMQAGGQFIGNGLMMTP